MKKSRDYKTQYKITIGFLTALVISAVVYLYYLNVSVVHVVMRQDAMNDVKDLQTEIAILEAQYIDAQHTIASRIAILDGYHTDTDKIFVSRDAAGLVFVNQ